MVAVLMKLWEFIAGLFKQQTAPLEAVKILQDVIERLDKRLQDCEERNDRLEHQVAMADVNHDNAIVICDDAGLVVEWNEAASKLFKFSREDMLGKAVSKMIPLRMRAKHFQSFRLACDQKKSLKDERFKHTDSPLMATKSPSS